MANVKKKSNINDLHINLHYNPQCHATADNTNASGI